MTPAVWHNSGMPSLVRGGFRFLSSEVRGLEAAVYVLAGCAILSSLLGLVRDRLFAHTFGAGTELDIYYAAFRIPDILFVATGALVSVYVLIPELARRSSAEQKNYIDTVLVGFSVLSSFLAVIALILAPYILRTLFPQLTLSGHLAALVGLTRILLLQPILLGFSNILAAITQSRRRYALYAVSPLLYNLGIISGLLVLYPLMGMRGLAWGVVIGAALHLGIQVPSVLRDGFLRELLYPHEWRALLLTASVSIPRALTLSMNQISFLGLMVLAALLSSGSIAVFMFAYNLQAVPLAIIGASYSVAAFPALASALSEGRHEEFLEHISTAARHILFWSLPVSALVIVLRAHIVRVILGSGAFDWTDTRLTAAAFGLFSLSLAAQGLMLLLARGYYAAGRTFVPFIVATVGAGVTVALGVLFTGFLRDETSLRVLQDLMRVQGLSGSAVLALPLAYAIASIAGLIILVIHFEWRWGGFFARIRRSLLHAAAAALSAGLAAYLALTLVGPLTLSSTLASVFLRGLFGGLVGIAAAMAVYALLKNREYAETVSAIRARLWRVPLAPEHPIASGEDISQH